ncbi:MAG TPA: DNA-processing protein DprA, partial [Planctomycetaceae bacterium]|nr:DNA-processing protein DprA [Planctomycetaceae bacterium]
MTDFAAAPDDLASDVVDALRLTLVPGIGSRMYQLLVDRFGSPGAVLEASIAQLREVSGVGPKLAMAIVAEGTPAAARAEWERCRAAGARLLLRGRHGYPPPLDRIPDPPGVLYCRGDWRPADELAIGIVGSRHCTPYGRQQAERLAGGLARAGITI